MPVSASADTGVGINLGKVQLPGILKPSATYDLPSMAVYNTGTETANYEMAITFNEHQPQLKPRSSWISFSPGSFSLAPGQAQIVTVSLVLPADVQSGDYYAYLEADAVAGNSGTASVTAASAAKFYFSAQGNPAAKARQNTRSAFKGVIAALTAIKASKGVGNETGI